MYAALHKAWLALLFSSFHRQEERERKERERETGAERIPVGL